jgi:Protein of unknown function (DUF3429)
MNHKLSRTAFYLGLSGLIPQIFANYLVLGEFDPKPGLLIGFSYAALILSFLGGLWWGLAAARADASNWVYCAGVCPSLIAFASFVAWLSGANYQLPYFVVGLALLVTPAIDKILQGKNYVPEGWLRMRLILSIGLGLLTLNLAIRA